MPCLARHGDAIDVDGDGGGIAVHAAIDLGIRRRIALDHTEVQAREPSVWMYTVEHPARSSGASGDRGPHERPCKRKEHGQQDVDGMGQQSPGLVAGERACRPEGTTSYERFASLASSTSAARLTRFMASMDPPCMSGWNTRASAL